MRKKRLQRKKIVSLQRMMKFLLHIWFVLMILTGILVSCHRAPQYDSRLVAADSVIYEDSAKQAKSILSEIDPNNLNDASTAYYDLLYTQASYIGYDDITDKHDSIINRSLNYYKKHSKESEKLTRAYIYEGAVLENLLKPDSAMWYYKHADVTATDNLDYFNMGYARLRMGKLYASYRAYDGRDIEKMEQALDYFRKAKNTKYQIVCLKDLGALYRSKDINKAEELLNEAISLAEKESDNARLKASLSTLAYAYFMKSNTDKTANRKAYQILKRIKYLGLSGLSFNDYTTFASVYANLGMIDSAEHYLGFAELSNSDDSTLYFEAQSMIAKAKGDMLNYFRYSHMSDSTSFEKLRQPEIVNIMYSELSFDKEHANQLEHERRKRSYIIASIVGAIMLSLLLIALLLYRRSHRYDRLIVELKDQSQSQMNDLSHLQGNISEMKIKDEQLKDFISSNLGMMREMIEACYHEPNNRIAESMKRIVKFQDSNKDNWIKLYDYIDMEHNDIMTHTRNNYPQLDDRDPLLLALTCMRYSYIQTAIIMGYSNATSVSVLKQRLAKKMGLDCSLNDYIDRYSTPANDQNQ